MVDVAIPRPPRMAPLEAATMAAPVRTAASAAARTAEAAARMEGAAGARMEGAAVPTEATAKQSHNEFTEARLQRLRENSTQPLIVCG